MTTLKELIKTEKQRIEAFKVEDALFNVKCMVAKLLKCNNINQLFFYLDDKVSEEIVEELQRMVQRRCKHEPLQQILGEWSFLNLNLQVTPDVLIPRPETEEVVLWSIKLIEEKIIPNFGAEFRFIDVGTGTGAIGISIAQHFNNASGTLLDISDKALAVAQANIERYSEIKSRVTLKKSDLLGECSEQSCEIIVSNPPYIKTSEIDLLMPEVRDFEPLLALDGGIDGLMIIRRLIKQAESVLVSNGYLIFEHGVTQQEEILGLFNRSRWHISIGKKDLYGNARYVYAQKK